MRHPTTGLSEDDLSRLTVSSSNTSSVLTTPSHDNTTITTNGNGGKRLPTCSIISAPDEQVNNLKNFHHLQHFGANANIFHPSYLPEYIDPLEWQKSSRKRKDRNDSTSSTTQDRKLVRSNSEELLSNADCEVIRRVSSSEDFKRPLQDITDENSVVLKTIQEDETTNAAAVQRGGGGAAESIPARNSPNRDCRRYKENDDSECENERRRSSERFCKSRAPPGRKVGVTKKSSSSSSSGKYIQKFRTNDENNVYKYDISALKHERRGFVSKFKVEERGQRKEEANDGAAEDQQLAPGHDYNDNNLIDFHTLRNDSRSSSSATAAQKFSPAEALPWDCIAAGGGVEVELQPQVITDVEPVRSFRTFTKMENIKTREIMQQSLPQISYETPEERLKHVNKKLTALKKKLVMLEEGFEKRNGYRPSQVEKMNDRQIKCTLAEMNKLRKEKHELKADPMAALGLKISGGMLDVEKKTENMKETLEEIEKKLLEKRDECKRSECLDNLTSDQLVQEKTSVQHGLLYFESLYGRPATKEERDIARPLYDRYRQLKRMVSRSIATSGSAGCASELPTILENEAMAFTFESVQPISTSTDSNSPLEPGAFMDSPSSDRSPPSTEDASSLPQSQTSSQSLVSENVHTLSVDELWEQLEKVREEKHEIKRTIREYETLFEEQNGRKMLKTDRKFIEETYGQYKELKAKVRLLQALVRKHTT